MSLAVRIRALFVHIREVAATLACLPLFAPAAAAAAQEDPVEARPTARAAQPGTRAAPNVLLYVVDTLRSDALRTYGHAGAKTPNADALGHEGTVFSNSHAPSSWTRASIGSILTGLHPDVHGAESRDDVMSGGLELLSERFAKQGYATGAILTNPNIGSFYGFSQGFDDFVELYARRERGYVNARESTTPSSEAVRRAIDWIDRTNRPFLLLVLTIDPHWPYEPPAEAAEERRSNAALSERFVRNGDELDARERERVRGLYQAEVESNDASLGRLLGHLRAKGIYDDTIVVYTADHGEEFWEHGGTQHGSALYEESTRIPLILRYPHRIPMAARVARPVGLVDIAPTLLELAGIDTSFAFDGSSLAFDGSSLAERGADDRALYAVLDLDGHRLHAITRHPWKLIWNKKNGEKQLFNLALDEQELWDLAQRHPLRASALTEELHAMIAANDERYAELHEGDETAPVGEHEIPEAAREALKALGYID